MTLGLISSYLNMRAICAACGRKVVPLLRSAFESNMTIETLSDQSSQFQNEKKINCEEKSNNCLDHIKR